MTDGTVDYDWFDIEYVEGLEATATRLRELLKGIKEMLGYCPYCWARTKDPCADECKIGKELADE